MRSLGTYQVLDTTVELRADRRMAELLGDTYADLRAPGSATADHVVSARRRQGLADHDVLENIRRQINDLAVASARSSHTIVRGGAVEIGGIAVAFVGGGSAGKSSLTAFACLRGHPYISDDIVAVDPDGNVRPYHRPVGVRPSAAAQLNLDVPPGPFEHGVAIRMGALSSLSPGAPLGLIVFVRRHPEATSCEPEPSSMSLMQLSGHAVGLDVLPKVVFRRLESLARTVPALALWHHDLAAGIDLVEAEVDELRTVNGRSGRTTH